MEVKYYKDTVEYNRRIKCDIIEQGYVDGDTKWRYNGITSPFHRLYYIEEGEVFLRDDEYTYNLTKGHLYLIPRNTVMDYYAKSDFKKYYFHLNYSMHGRMDILELLDPMTELSVDEASLTALLEMFREHISLEAYAKGISALYAVLGNVLTGMSEEQLPMIIKDMPYQGLIEEMFVRLDAGFTVEDMASYCEQSVSDFTRKFKRATGLSPKAYLHKQLIEESKLMLLRTDNSVKAIASELGYDDSLYFSRFFRKKVGVSPLQYRQSQISI